MVFRGSRVRWVFAAASSIASTILLLGLSRCVSDNNNTGGQGSEGQRCFENMTCNTGLTCISNTCVKLDGSTNPDVSMPNDTGADATSMMDAGGGCDASTNTDPKNCGRCGHDCIVGGCMNGACQPWAIDIGLPFEGRSAAQGGTVFFTSGYAGNSGKTHACARTGCLPDAATYATGFNYPFHVAADTNNVYFSTATSVHRCARAGCNNSPDLLATTTDTEILSDGTNLYMSSVQGGLVTCTAPTCTNKQPMFDNDGGLPVQPMIAIDSTSIYWLSDLHAYACTRSNCQATKRRLFVQAASSLPYRIAVGGANVYIGLFGSEKMNSVVSCPIGANSNCTPNVVADGLDVVSLTADATNVYFTDQGTAAASMADGFVAYCPASGCPNKKAIKIIDAKAGAYISSDNEALYVTQGGGNGPILAIAKP